MSANRRKVARGVRLLSQVALVLALLGALWWMPVRIDARADINRVPTLHFDAWIWKLRLAYDAVIERKAGSLSLTIRRRGTKQKPDPDGAALVATLKELRAAVAFVSTHRRSLAMLGRAMRLQGLSVSIRIGTGDAAHTAVLHGLCCTALQTIAHHVQARAGFRPAMRAVGDYRNASFLCSAEGIIAFHVGNIIVIAVRVALESAARRIGKAAA